MTQREPVTVACRKCSQEFTYTPGRGHPRVYCDDHSRRASAQRYRARHPEVVRLSREQWRSDNGEKVKALMACWRDQNRDRESEYRRAQWADPERRAVSQRRYQEWADRNRENLNAKSVLWQKANPEYVSARGKRQRARRAGAAVSDFTAAQWRECLDEFGHRCAYCGSAEPLEQEHVIPLVRGGPHTRSNVVPACRSCNARKGTQTAAEFLDARQRVER